MAEAPRYNDKCQKYMRGAKMIRLDVPKLYYISSRKEPIVNTPKIHLLWTRLSNIVYAKVVVEIRSRILCDYL